MSKLDNWHGAGPANPNWRGGRSITSHGYVLVMVGKADPRADSRGYIYEHRLVAEAMLGRSLTAGEVVDHINGDKGDNRPENLRVMSLSAHTKRHFPDGPPRARKS